MKWHEIEMREGVALGEISNMGPNPITNAAGVPQGERLSDVSAHPFRVKHYVDAADTH